MSENIEFDDIKVGDTCDIFYQSGDPAGGNPYECIFVGKKYGGRNFVGAMSVFFQLVKIIKKI